MSVPCCTAAGFESQGLLVQGSGAEEHLQTSRLACCPKEGQPLVTTNPRLFRTIGAVATASSHGVPESNHVVPIFSCTPKWPFCCRSLKFFIVDRPVCFTGITKLCQKKWTGNSPSCTTLSSSCASSAYEKPGAVK